MARDAFTRLELAVAVVALVVLLGLLLPAINGNQGSARRIQCAHHLGELAKATQQFVQTYQRYPGYVEGFGADEAGAVKVGTWVVSLLPYIAQEPLYDLWQDSSLTEQWNRRGGNHPLNDDYYPKIHLLICNRDENAGEPLAPLSFAANCGFFADTLPPDYEGLDPHQVILRSSRSANGVFTNQLPAEARSVMSHHARALILGSANGRPTRLDDIRDGLTMTLCMAENLYTDSWSYVGRHPGWAKTQIGQQTYYGDEASPQDAIRAHVGLVWLYKAQPAVAGVPDFIQLAPPSSWSKQPRFNVQWARPSSNHTGIFNASFLGGSVASLSKEMDYRVYQALLTPHGKRSDVPDKQFIPRDDDL